MPPWRHKSWHLHCLKGSFFSCPHLGGFKGKKTVVDTWQLPNGLGRPALPLLTDCWVEPGSRPCSRPSIVYIRRQMYEASDYKWNMKKGKTHERSTLVIFTKPLKERKTRQGTIGFVDQLNKFEAGAQRPWEVARQNCASLLGIAAQCSYNVSTIGAQYIDYFILHSTWPWINNILT